MKRHVTLALVLSLAACGGPPGASDSPTATESTVASDDSSATDSKLAGAVIDVTVGTDSGTDRVEEVALGSTVTLNIVNPSADDEYHLHGYDLSPGKTAKGETATITFTAEKAGEFEVESHVTEELLLTIIVK